MIADNHYHMNYYKNYCSRCKTNSLYSYCYNRLNIRYHSCPYSLRNNHPCNNLYSYLDMRHYMYLHILHYNYLRNFGYMLPCNLLHMYFRKWHYNLSKYLIGKFLHMSLCKMYNMIPYKTIHSLST
ncbi:MAG: hypothetical protein IJ767_01990 [Bacteroidaceae bacterium]|nr:hypothetical protein [Bacteroidaceae bacterium]